MKSSDSGNTEPSILSLALSDGTPLQSFKVALVVGTVLTLINQGDILLAGEIPSLWKTLLTFCVPYAVSSYGAAMAKRTHRRSVGAPQAE